MKAFSIFALTGLLSLAQAQSQCNSVASAVPACATSCIQSAASKVGCGILDYVCQCGAASSAAINSAAFGCVLSTCGPQTGLAVQTSAQAVCACASSAGPAAGGGSSMAASSMAASSMMASSSMMAGSSMMASGSSSMMMMSSGAASAGSSASMPMATSAPASVASSAAPAGSSAASSSGAVFSGAGFETIMSVGAGLAVFLGVIAAL